MKTGYLWAKGLLFELQFSGQGLRRILIKIHPRIENLPGAPRPLEEALLFALRGQDFMMPVLDIPDITPFRSRVLQVLKEIPYGQVKTYGELAKKLGIPRGGRAIGQVMHWNPIPVFFP